MASPAGRHRPQGSDPRPSTGHLQERPSNTVPSCGQTLPNQRGGENVMAVTLCVQIAPWESRGAGTEVGEARGSRALGPAQGLAHHLSWKRRPTRTWPLTRSHLVCGSLPTTRARGPGSVLVASVPPHRMSYRPASREGGQSPCAGLQRQSRALTAATSQATEPWELRAGLPTGGPCQPLPCVCPTAGAHCLVQGKLANFRG